MHSQSSLPIPNANIFYLKDGRFATISDPEGNIRRQLDYLEKMDIPIVMTKELEEYITKECKVTIVGIPSDSRMYHTQLLKKALDEKHYFRTRLLENGGIYLDLTTTPLVVLGDLLDCITVDKGRDFLSAYILANTLIRFPEFLKFLIGNRDGNLFRLIQERTQTFFDFLQKRTDDLTEKHKSGIKECKTKKELLKFWQDKIVPELNTTTKDGEIVYSDSGKPDIFEYFNFLQYIPDDIFKIENKEARGEALLTALKDKAIPSTMKDIQDNEYKHFEYIFLYTRGAPLAIECQLLELGPNFQEEEKASGGTLVLSEKDKQNRWVEFFKKFISKEGPMGQILAVARPMLLIQLGEKKEEVVCTHGGFIPPKAKALAEEIHTKILSQAQREYKFDYENRKHVSHLFNTLYLEGTYYVYDPVKPKSDRDVSFPNLLSYYRQQGLLHPAGKPQSRGSITTTPYAEVLIPLGVDGEKVATKMLSGVVAMFCGHYNNPGSGPLNAYGRPCFAMDSGKQGGFGGTLCDGGKITNYYAFTGDSPIQEREYEYRNYSVELDKAKGLGINLGNRNFLRGSDTPVKVMNWQTGKEIPFDDKFEDPIAVFYKDNGNGTATADLTVSTKYETIENDKKKLNFVNAAGSITLSISVWKGLQQKQEEQAALAAVAKSKKSASSEFDSKGEAVSSGSAAASVSTPRKGESTTVASSSVVEKDKPAVTVVEKLAATSSSSALLMSLGQGPTAASVAGAPPTTPEKDIPVALSSSISTSAVDNKSQAAASSVVKEKTPFASFVGKGGGEGQAASASVGGPSSSVSKFSVLGGAPVAASASLAVSTEDHRNKPKPPLQRQNNFKNRRSGSTN